MLQYFHSSSASSIFDIPWKLPCILDFCESITMNQEVSPLPLISELISKIDSKRYTCNVKVEHGKYNMEILDNYVLKPELKTPTPAKSETPARESRFEKTRIFESRSRSRNIRNFDSKLKHGSTRNARGMHTKSLNNRNSAILESDSAANSDTKSKVNYKSPSEKGRDNKRLRKYLYVKNPLQTPTADSHHRVGV